MHVAIIVLAAGASSRMGQSKQLLKIDDETLLVRSVLTGLSTGSKQVVVVLGANAEEHASAIKHLPVNTVINDHWENGMGSSIKKGIIYISEKYPEVESIIIMVCDQPLLNEDHLQKIIEASKTSGKNIIASYYDHSPGVPALFSKFYFKGLLSLKDQEGAKKLMIKHPEDTLLIDFPEGDIDLDTEEEYLDFLKGKHQK